MITTRQTCRICGSPLKTVFDLGEPYIVGYDTSPEPEGRRAPLQLAMCDTDYENACGLVQLAHTVYPDMLYREYFYVSGLNESMKSHLYSIADDAMSFLSRDELRVLDIGCNDGTLLKYCMKKYKVKDAVGFDPALTLYPTSQEIGAKITPDYFSYSSENGKFDLIFSIAMFYGLEDPCSFVNDVRMSLDDDGIWILEMCYLPSMLESNAFDSICHEHLEYYSLCTLDALLKKFNLEIIDIHLNNVNGGTMQVWVSHRLAYPINSDAFSRIMSLKKQEFLSKIDTTQPFDEFKKRVDSNGEKLKDFLSNCNDLVFAYGASTKGAITLQYFDIDYHLVPYCADRNPVKFGKYIRGSGINIISEVDAKSLKPAYFLVLPWHFMDFFREREKGQPYKMVAPMPEFKVIDL